MAGRGSIHPLPCWSPTEIAEPHARPWHDSPTTLEDQRLHDHLKAVPTQKSLLFQKLTAHPRLLHMDLVQAETSAVSTHPERIMADVSMNFCPKLLTFNSPVLRLADARGSASRPGRGLENPLRGRRLGWQQVGPARPASYLTLSRRVHRAQSAPRPLGPLRPSRSARAMAPHPPSAVPRNLIGYSRQYGPLTDR